jgi:TolB-like protein
MKLRTRHLPLLSAILPLAHFSLLIFFACASTQKAPDELDTAIRDASDYLNDNIPKGSKIVILNVQSDSVALSNYIIEELIANAVNDRVFEVVDRQQLDLIRAEQNFQFSGEVDDNLALAVGKFFGAQSIVSGSVSPLGNRHRLTVRSLEVQSARVQGQYNRNINPSPTITALMKSSAGGQATRSGGTATTASASGGTTTAATPAATPARLAVLANGTYTFWPRPRAMVKGRDINAYLDKIVVRGGFFNIHVVGSPSGTTAVPEGHNSWAYMDGKHFTIQDLDTPRLSYTGADGHTADRIPRVISFQNTMTGRRFSLTFQYYSGDMHVFEEFDLTKPNMNRNCI